VLAESVYPDITDIVFGQQIFVGLIITYPSHSFGVSVITSAVQIYKLHDIKRK